jgi:hypothetical protein
MSAGLAPAGHTPGPWRIGHGLTNDGQRYLMAGPSDDPVRVALIDRRSPYKRGRGYEGDCAERDANACLIKAAPDLLAALQAAVACRMVPVSSAKDGGASALSEQVRVADQIRAAIARATGSQP